jgi:hypothetical protein
MIEFLYTLIHRRGARGSVFDLGNMLEAGRSLIRFPITPLDFFNLPNLSTCTIALGSTRPLLKMSTNNLPWNKGLQESKTKKLTKHLRADFLRNVGN